MFTDDTKVDVTPEDDALIAPPKEGEADPLDSITDVEELRKRAKANRSIATRYKNRASKAPAPAPAASPANPAPTNPPKPEPTAELDKRLGNLELSERKRQAGFKLGLSPEETDTLFRFAGDKDIDAAFNDPFFQSGLKETRRANRVKNAIPSGSNAAVKVDGKSFEEMTPEERKKNWGAVVASKTKKGS